jgi:hypothetical protein
LYVERSGTLFDDRSRRVFATDPCRVDRQSRRRGGGALGPGREVSGWCFAASKGPALHCGKPLCARRRHRSSAKRAQPREVRATGGRRRRRERQRADLETDGRRAGISTCGACGCTADATVGGPRSLNVTARLETVASRPYALPSAGQAHVPTFGPHLLRAPGSPSRACARRVQRRAYDGCGGRRHRLAPRS